MLDAIIAFCYDSILLQILGRLMQKNIQMNIRIPLEIMDWGKKTAKTNRRSLTSFIVMTLEELKSKEEQLCDKERGKERKM